MTVQAADRRLGQISQNPAHLILIDEVHMGGSAAQYGRVMACAPNAVTIGFTGTPTPSTFEIFPHHVKGRSASWLTENGFLSPLKYVCPDPLDLSKVRIRNGDYDPTQAIAALEDGKIYGNVIDDFRGRALGVPSLGFCVNVDHAMDTAKQFRRAGHDCHVLTGKDKKEEVDYKIDALKDGGLVFSVDKVSAGFDLPDLRAIISLRPSESEPLWVQQLGRVARTADGKDHGLVLDHVGNTLRLGTLTLDRDWKNLKKTSGSRRSEEGACLGVRQCEECLHIFDAGPSQCPACGVIMKKDHRIPKDTAVRLREQDAAEIEAQRQSQIAQKKRLGQSIKQMTVWLNRKTRDYRKAREQAIDNMTKRYHRAIRNGDDDIAAYAATELRSVGRKP